MPKDGKTEKATPRKRKLEREKGNLPRSKEMGTFLTLLSFYISIFVFGEYLVQKSAALVNDSFNMIGEEGSAKHIILSGFESVFIILMPVFAIGAIFHIVNYFLQVGFLFSPKIMKPDFKKLFNFKGYITDLFSRRKAVEVIKSFSLLILLGMMAYYVLKGQVNGMAETIWSPWNVTLSYVIHIFKLSFGAILFLLFIIGMVDYFYQRWEHSQKIMMKKDEVKDEMKNSEGNPEVKRKRKELMFAMLQRDVSTKIPEATVIINNPTHISVAIRYKRGEDDLPIVIAKGEDQLALYMRTLAKEHEVPMVNNVSLARSIYFNVEVNEYIHEDMFQAAADVLKYLIETKQLEM